MNEDTWVRMEEGFNRWPQSKASPVDPAEFDQAMQSFGPIDPGYREFVLRCGGGVVGPNPVYRPTAKWRRRHLEHESA
jgi:hypothetical protein